MARSPAHGDETIEALIRVTIADADMLPAMMAAFPTSRAVNPASWDAKMNFWKRILRATFDSRTCLASRYTLVVDDALPAHFAVDGLAPRGIMRVLRDLYDAGEIVPVEDVLQSPGKPGWMATLVANPIIWGLTAISVLPKPDPTEMPQGLFVVRSNLEKDIKAVARLAKSVTALSDTIVPVADVLAQLGMVDANANDVELLLQAAAQQQVIAYDPALRVAKLPPHGADTVPAGGITPLDRNVLTLKSTLARVNAQLHEVEESIEKTMYSARAAIRDGKKPQAARYLKQKKAFESLRDKRAQTVLTLESVLHQLDLADTESAVLAAYSAGTSALKALAPKIEIVDATMDALADALADHQEIDQAMSVHHATIGPIDEAELEEELEQLMVEQMPQVPTRPMPVRVPVARPVPVGIVRYESEEAGLDRAESDDVLATALGGLSAGVGGAGEDRRKKYGNEAMLA
ncbi:Charged multivesicular body protein 7 [Allomyces arbusculus]|nr:Charged multivesicular body protein 7 [Allomyces arbusculus]